MFLVNGPAKSYNCVWSEASLTYYNLSLVNRLAKSYNYVWSEPHSHWMTGHWWQLVNPYITFSKKFDWKRWWKYDSTMMKLRWHDIIFQWCNCIIVILRSCHRCFIIVPSCFHHCTIVHRGSERQKQCYFCPNGTTNRLMFQRYNIMTCFASRWNLTSRSVSRASTRDKGSFEAIYHWIVLPLLFKKNKNKDQQGKCNVHRTQPPRN
jgi:hypothetical protein